MLLPFGVIFSAFLTIEYRAQRHKIPLHEVEVDASSATVQILEDHVIIKIPLRKIDNPSVHNDR